MRYILLNKTVYTVLVSLLFASASVSQQCEVDKESIKGTYTGDCKKGKAHGKGKAVGTDSYEGDFKNGLPDGEGTYTWNNQSVYVGKFSKGLKEGKGIMTMKRGNEKDSIIEGFWKKDAYAGKYEKPWVLYSKTGSVRSVDVDFAKDEIRKVKVIITNTTGGVPSLGGQLAQYKVDNVIVVKGFFERQTSLESHYKSTETSLIEVTFPFRIKLMMAREEVELEFFEAGSYTVNIAINN
jgi:hypothetical protein